MEISPTTAGTTQTTATAPAASAQDTTAMAVAGDFQTFLTLLTTQMRNQDPLKPMESTEFIAQLASFSAVEQQVRANDRLDAILGVLGGGDTAGLAQWIGKEVRAPGKAAFAGEAVEVGLAPVEGADKATLVVTNDFGQIVARLPIAADAEAIDWEGLDDLGNPVAHGRYSFAVESFQGETPLSTRPGTVFNTVDEVRFEDGRPVLLLADGGRIGIDAVTALR